MQQLGTAFLFRGNGSFGLKSVDKIGSMTLYFIILTSQNKKIENRPTTEEVIQYAKDWNGADTEG